VSTASESEDFFENPPHPRQISHSQQVITSKAIVSIRTPMNNGTSTMTSTMKNGRRKPPRRHLSQIYTMAALSLFGLILLSPDCRLVTNTVTTVLVDAFANNLVETNIGCMTDLSTEEVIMNNEVKPPEESDFPKMHLVVLGDSDKELETPYYYDPSSTKTVRIAFVIPYSTSEFNDDLQFVVEFEEPGKEDSNAAEFVAGGPIGCENNKRVSARHMDNNGLVVLQINDPTAKLRVWAGWATGHSAVRLVPDLILEPGEASERIESPEKEGDLAKLKEEVEEIEEEIEEIEEREKEEEKLEKMLSEKAEPAVEKQDEGQKEKAATQNSKLKRKRKNMLEKSGNMPKGLDVKMGARDLGLEIRSAADSGNAANSRGNDNAKTLQQKIRDKTLDLGRGTGQSNRNRQQKLSDYTASKREHKRADKISEDMDDGGTDDDLPEVLHDAGNDDVLPDEGDIADDVEEDVDRGDRGVKLYPHDGLDHSNHFVGCAFFAVTMGLFFVVFGRKRDKGRRDL